MNRALGFTLVEVVIAMIILSFLSLFTMQSIHKALATKTKVQKDIDRNSNVRDALRIMERDINLAFNYHDVYTQLYNMAQKERQQAAQQKSTAPPPPGTIPPPPGGAQPPPPPGGAYDPNKYQLKTEKIYTQFIGEPQALDFTSISNVRMMEESPISEQAEIGYKLKPCRRRSTQQQSSQCLWRRIDNYLHDDITKDGQETVLLENVKDFKLRYLGPGREDEWIDTWITTERGDDLTKNKFPYAVEITLEVQDTSPGSKDKPLRVTAVAALRNPNNPNPNDPNNPNNPNGQPNGQNGFQNPGGPQSGVQPPATGLPPASTH